MAAAHHAKGRVMVKTAPLPGSDPFPDLLVVKNRSKILPEASA
jgi:hypothetical protein